MKYRNPVVPGFYPDPSAIRVGQDYYLVTSTFEFFPGVPVMHSRDMVHWKKIGYCLTRKSQLDLTNCPASRGIWAATIRHHNGVFYMITTVMNGGVCRKFFVTATDPAGEWSDPIWIDQPGIDPTLLFDDDGKVYLTSNGGKPGINQALLDVKTGKLLSEDRIIWKGTGGAYPEGPRLYKINGWYYLSIAEGGCQYGHMQTIARSRSPWGPFESCPRNPILTHRDRGGSHPIQGLGHMEFVQTPEGAWWAYALGYRISRQYFYHLGRETFLMPVTWGEDGWPIIGNNGMIELEMDGPLPPSQPWPTPPVRDDFDDAKLGLEWNYLRNPDMNNYSLKQRKGWLTLTPSPVNIDDLDSPTLVCRRQEHWDCAVSTRLDFSPVADNEEAGLSAFYYNEHHYDIGLVKSGTGRQLIVRRRIGDLTAIVARADVPAGPVEPAMIADKLNYRMGYMRDGQFVEMATGRTQFLSCEAAPVGFTGVCFGLYATGNGKNSATAAHFDWFDYKPLDEQTPPKV
jgi:xylan 1,4-beta-xylosidase